MAQVAETHRRVEQRDVVGEVAERRASPQSRRRRQGLRGGLGIASRDRRTAGGMQPLGDVDIELVGPQPQDVAARDGVETFLAAGLQQPLAESMHMMVQRAYAGRRRSIAPHGVDECPVTHDSIRVERQHCAHDALLAAPERVRTRLIEQVNRSE